MSVNNRSHSITWYNYRNQIQYWDRKKHLAAAKSRLVKCCRFTILLYGVETRTLIELLMKKISAFEMWIYRYVLRMNMLEGSLYKRRFVHNGHLLNGSRRKWEKCKNVFLLGNFLLLIFHGVRDCCSCGYSGHIPVKICALKMSITKDIPPVQLNFLRRFKQNLHSNVKNHLIPRCRERIFALLPNDLEPKCRHNKFFTSLVIFHTLIALHW